MICLPSKFELFASRPFSRDELDRLTEEEEGVLLCRRRNSVIQTCFECGMSKSTVHRRQKSILQKLDI